MSKAHTFQCSMVQSRCSQIHCWGLEEGLPGILTGLKLCSHICTLYSDTFLSELPFLIHWFWQPRPVNLGYLRSCCWVTFLWPRLTGTTADQEQPTNLLDLFKSSQPPICFRTSTKNGSSLDKWPSHLYWWWENPKNSNENWKNRNLKTSIPLYWYDHHYKYYYHYHC